MSTQMQETSDAMIFRRTNSEKGRHISVSPDNSSMKHLVYGRIILDDETPRADFDTGQLETGLICLKGECAITIDGETHKINRHDSIYIPRDSAVQVATESAVDLVECSAEVDNKYPVQV